MSPRTAAATLAAMEKWAAAVVVCVALAVPAHAAEPKGAAKAAAPAGAGPTSIAVGLVSVPVLTVRKVRAYQYGIVAVRVGDVAARMKEVCEKRFEITDAFLTYLHGKPFPTGADQDGVRAQQDMLALAKQLVGDFVTGVEVSWSNTPRPLDASVFPNNTATLCKS